jgi:hypothetical protein
MGNYDFDAMLTEMLASVSESKDQLDAAEASGLPVEREGCTIALEIGIDRLHQFLTDVQARVGGPKSA